MSIGTNYGPSNIALPGMLADTDHIQRTERIANGADPGDFVFASGADRQTSPGTPLQLLGVVQRTDRQPNRGSKFYEGDDAVPVVYRGRVWVPCTLTSYTAGSIIQAKVDSTGKITDSATNVLPGVFISDVQSVAGLDGVTQVAKIELFTINQGTGA